MSNQTLGPEELEDVNLSIILPDMASVWSSTVQQTVLSSSDLLRAYKALASNYTYTFTYDPTQGRWEGSDCEDSNRPKGLTDEDYDNFKKITDTPKKLKRRDYESQVHTDTTKENPYWLQFSRSNDTLLHGRRRHYKR